MAEFFRVAIETEKERSLPPPKNPNPKTKSGEKKGKEKLRRRKAAPFLSIRTGIGKPSRSDEEHTPTGGKGTTNEPFDGGAFTLEVLAHAGKGVNGGAASGNRRRSREGEQRRLCSRCSRLSRAAAVVDGKKRGKGNGSRGAVALAAVHGGRSGPSGGCPFFLDGDGKEEKEEGKQERKRQRRS